MPPRRGHHRRGAKGRDGDVRDEDKSPHRFAGRITSSRCGRTCHEHDRRRNTCSRHDLGLGVLLAVVVASSGSRRQTRLYGDCRALRGQPTMPIQNASPKRTV